MMNLKNRFCILIDNSSIIEFDIEEREYDLFLNDVSGLNYTSSNEYINLGNKYIKIKEKDEQKKITLSLIFSGNHDEILKKYYLLINQIYSYSYDLKLLYMPFENKNEIYQAEVDVSSIERKWIANNTLEMSITFFILENFYKEKKYYFNNDESVNSGGFIFDKSKFDVDILTNIFNNSITINNIFSFNSGCQLLIFGPISKPEWIQHVNNKEYAHGKLNIDIEEDKILMIDTLSLPYKITHLDSNFNELNNLYQFRDFNFNDWAIVIQNGINRISLKQNGNKSIKAMLKIKEEIINV